MFEVKITGARRTIVTLEEIAKASPGVAAGAMNAVVKRARMRTIREVAAATHIPQRILRGKGALGRGGQFKRTKARARRLSARLIGLVQGVKVSRIGTGNPHRYPLTIDGQPHSKLFRQKMPSGHTAYFARSPLPSSRGRGGRKPNLPIKEAVVSLMPISGISIARNMKIAATVEYPKELWARLEKAAARRAKLRS